MCKEEGLAPETADISGRADSKYPRIFDVEFVKLSIESISKFQFDRGRWSEVQHLWNGKLAEQMGSMVEDFFQTPGLRRIQKVH